MKKSIFILLAFLSLSGFLMGQWTQGAGIDGGDIRYLTKIGTDIYAGSWYGGIFRSSDNGGNWTPLMNGLPTGVAVGEIIGNNGSLFAGTTYWSKYANGIYRSDDNGATWVQKNNGIQYDTLNSWNVANLDITGLAVCGNYVFAATGANGIYRSDNNGETWTYAASDTLMEYYQVRDLHAIGTMLFAGTYNGGFFRSTDFGVTWTQHNTGLPSGAVVSEITSSGVNLYILGGSGVNWSPNNGDYWIPLTTCSGGQTSALSVDGNILFYSTINSSGGPQTYKSINGGTTWTNIPAISGDGGLGRAVHALLNTGNYVLAGNLGNHGISSNGGGVVRSTDGGETWAESVGLSALNCNAITSHGTDIFAGTRFYSGIYKSSDNGANWTKSLLPGTTTANYQVLSMLSSGTDIYAGNYYGVYKSTDNGQTWQTTASTGGAVYALATNATYIFAGVSMSGMLRSSNGGATWTTINTGLITVQQKTVRAIAVNGSNIYIGTSKGVFRSDNDGTNWVAANGGSGSPGYSAFVKTLVVKGDTLFAGLSLGIGQTAGVIRSFDEGATWSLVFSNSGIREVWSLVLDGQTLYAGGNSGTNSPGGVYVSNDWGETWSSLNETFQTAPEVYSLHIANNTLFAGTYGQSVWQYSLSQTPATFAVTGGGSYCQGTSGMPVGVSNSQTGVTYTLYKNTVAQEPTVAGTGSPISFGLQTEGTYTVEGTNSTGTTIMTGSAVITEILPLPVNVTITSDQNDVCPRTTVTFTATPENGGTPSYQWFVNSLPVGFNSDLFAYIPVNGDEVYVEMTSSLGCVTNNPASSNTIVMTVGDDELPTISCVGNQTVAANAGNSYVVSGTEFDPTETGDNCSVASVINDFNSLETLAGASFPIGTTTVTWTITDGSENQASCSFDVTVTGETQPWTFTVTGQVHTINIPTSANPNINGTPLAAGDWIGVFFVDGNGDEQCAGAIQWNLQGSVINAYGNDPTTPEKDGFAANETFRWRMFKTSASTEYPAGATYDASMPNQGNFADFGLSKLTSLQAMVCQNYAFSTGWNSISSYITPFDADVETMFAPMTDELVIMRNLTNVYWPGQNLNTIGNFDSQSGYALKVNSDVDFSICGAGYSTKEVSLTTGWSYLPVLSECPANAMDLFGSHLNDIVIIQDLIGTKVFWPAMNVYSLETLEPGKAYKIKVVNPFTITFPACSGKSSTTSLLQKNSLSTPWGEIAMTPSAQTIAFTANALAEMISGDVIGAFDQNNSLFGYVEIIGNNEVQTITLFGDDATTIEKDGFAEGENISFRLYRTKTGESFDLSVVYDNSTDNYSGNFLSGSLSAVTAVTMSVTGIQNPLTSEISIYPNPANDKVIITVLNEDFQGAQIQLTDTKGSIVTEGSITGTHTTLDISNLHPGVYFVSIKSDLRNEISKLIIR